MATRPTTRSINRNAVSIDPNHRIRAANQSFDINSFRRATRQVTLTNRTRRKGRLYERRVPLVRGLIRALIAPGINELEIAEGLSHHIRNGTVLAAVFQTEGSAPNPTPRQVRDATLWHNLQRLQLRYRDRVARPIAKKTKLTKFENDGVKRLKRYLKQKIPQNRRPPQFNSRLSEYLYHIPEVYVDPQYITGPHTRIDLHSQHDELREAARVDHSHINDWLAFEEETTNNDHTHLWKVLTRAQLQRQKAEALQALPNRAYTRWENEVAQLHP